MEKEFKNNKRFSILRDENGEVYILDKLADARHYPSCGEELAQLCAYFGGLPGRKGESDIQRTLENVVNGKKPITDMIASMSM